MLKKIASNTIAQILSKIITAAISIVLIGLLTKYLTVELYGTYSKIYNYMYIFAFLVDLGLYTVTIKEISANKYKASYIFGNILTLRIISGIIVVFIAMVIAFFLPGYNSNLELGSIFIISIFTIFSLLNSSFLAYMQSYMKMEFSLFSVSLGKLVVLVLTFVLVYYVYPLNQINQNYATPFLWIMGIGTIGMFINMILNYIYVNITIEKIKLNFDFEYIKYIFKVSLPYGIALFLGVVYTKIDIFLLSLFEPGKLGERSVALYALPLKIMDVFMIMGAFFLNSLLPSLTENYKIKDLKKIDKILEYAFKLLFAGAMSILALGLVFKDTIIKIIATPDYLEKTNLNSFTASDAFSIVLFMILFFYVSLIFSYMLIVTNKQNKLLKINIILTIINIVGNIIMIPHLSFIGAGLVTVFTQIVFFILGYLAIKKVIDFKFPIRFIIFTIILGIATYYLGNYLLFNYSFGLYPDLLYGVGLMILFFIIIVGVEFKFKKV